MTNIPTLTFTLTRAPLTPNEQGCFADDLTHLGLDATVWEILNNTLATSTAYTVPKLLRAYAAKQLVGVALVLHCRQGMKAFFAEPLATIVDPIGIPQFVWNRSAVMIDQYSNPGFVTAGMERELFVEQALAYLKSCYLFGVLLCDKSSPPAGTFVRSSLMDYGVIELNSATVLEDYFARHKNLKRKLSKFRNKGGSVKTFRGALPQSLLGPIVHCLRQAEVHSMGKTPFQDNYVNMSLQSFHSDSQNVVHFVAYLNDDIVGYHSFALSGQQLCCLSGGFDRTQTTTFHAYENLIVESITFALEQKLSVINYGSIINDTKAKMMQNYVPTEVRFYSPLAPVRWLFPTIINNSFWSPALLGPYTDLATKVASTSSEN
jgi:hypothetical protein